MGSGSHPPRQSSGTPTKHGPHLNLRPQHTGGTPPEVWHIPLSRCGTTLQHLLPASTYTSKAAAAFPTVTELSGALSVSALAASLPRQTHPPDVRWTLLHVGHDPVVALVTRIAPF